MPNEGYSPFNGISLCSDCHLKAEEFFSTGTAIEGYSVDDLYAIIGSNYELAVEKSKKIKMKNEAQFEKIIYDLVVDVGAKGTIKIINGMLLSLVDLDHPNPQLKIRQKELIEVIEKLMLKSEIF